MDKINYIFNLSFSIIFFDEYYFFGVLLFPSPLNLVSSKLSGLQLVERLTDTAVSATDQSFSYWGPPLFKKIFITHSRGIFYQQYIERFSLFCLRDFFCHVEVITKRLCKTRVCRIYKFKNMKNKIHIHGRFISYGKSALKVFVASVSKYPYFSIIARLIKNNEGLIKTC